VQADSHSCKQACFVINSLTASRKISVLLKLPSCIVESRLYPHLFRFLQLQPNGLPTLRCFKIYFWSSSCNKSHLQHHHFPHILYVPSISLSGFTSHNSITIVSLSQDTTLDTQHSFCIPKHYFDTRNILGEKNIKMERWNSRKIRISALNDLTL
jgi:hypothetical protein